MWWENIKVGDKVRIIWKKKYFKPITGKVIKIWHKELHLDLGDGRTMAVYLMDDMIQKVEKCQ
ncbi:hypothetical protein DRN75_04260 [Nanoarchaeota archaeon]|nr:MAG: hypothetical protein DRN75_04260 [Nanoarchaeota archaeon]